MLSPKMESQKKANPMISFFVDGYQNSKQIQYIIILILIMVCIMQVR
ncbi:hypothetical protein BN1088_40005 [Sphingobacterium sp. PM2-P1-29]|nr:hypothetical protein BN1088_40005 [Sphingobacterium sp. PM2-P1-29]